MYPNAGIPSASGEYTETVSSFAFKIKRFANIVSAIGGCCGSTPKHIKELRKLNLKGNYERRNCEPCLSLSGTDLLQIRGSGFYKIGERANVSGSQKFKLHISNKVYNSALEIVRAQMLDGADIIDLNMDDALINAVNEMKTMINLIGSEPDLAKLPLMIDSSDWNVLLRALKLIQGRCLVNSISLKDGTAAFITKAKVIKSLGGIPITIAFDELGQASTIERRVQICRRAHDLLTREIGFAKEEIVFDLNTFAIATGIIEHSANARRLIESIKVIKCIFPLCSIVSGVSNLSFAFRGNSRIRNALHKVFLESATRVGLNLAIVNVKSLAETKALAKLQTKICSDLVLNTKPIELETILAAFNNAKAKEPTSNVTSWRA